MQEKGFVLKSEYKPTGDDYTEAYKAYTKLDSLLN